MADQTENSESSTDFARQNPYGPGANADETRQAQHQLTNDSPTDVNMNAVVARVQASTFSLMQANFEANANRLNKIFDHIAPQASKIT
jgi:hypothetical protein